jgi:poly(3-hydroxybutyrate) depolymerase
MRDGGKRSGVKPAATDATHHMPPTIIFQGDEDHTVHPRNAEALLAQCVAGRLSQTVEEEHKPDTGRSYTRSTVLDESGESIAELWLIRQGGHAWAGGNAAGSYTDPKGPDATHEMLKFFMAHPKRSSIMAKIGESFPFLR